MHAFNAVPSAAPKSVRLNKVTFSSISIEWRGVDCIHHNGYIIGYLVEYGEVGSASTHSWQWHSTTISSLMPSTKYSIKVAAINIVGIGVYSAPVMVTTQQSK